MAVARRLMIEIKSDVELRWFLMAAIAAISMRMNIKSG